MIRRKALKRHQIRRLSTLLAIDEFRVPSSFNPLSWDYDTKPDSASAIVGHVVKIQSLNRGRKVTFPVGGRRISAVGEKRKGIQSVLYKGAAL